MLTLGEKSTLEIMGPEGDTKLIWDTDNEDEVSAAQEMFDKLKKKGYLAYKTDKKGEKGEVIKKFDANAERIIMSPPIAGGSLCLADM